MKRQKRTSRRLSVCFLTLATVASCAARDRGPRWADSADTRAIRSDESALCRELAGRFVGLPREERAAVSTGPPPLAGRLWLRHCELQTEGGIVKLHLGGPAWYWLDHEKDGFRIRQPVALEVDALLSGTFGLESERSMIAIHFRPTKEPRVSVRVTNRVDVEPQTFWTTIVDALPFVLVSAKAQRQIGTEVASRFAERLDEGATFTLDLYNAESDIALGQLAPGDKPRHPFEAGKPWLANERQLLFPGGVHVLGPFEPAEQMPFDVVVEQGRGLVYQAACVADVERTLRVDADVPQLDRTVSRILGRLEGAGPHHTSLSLGDCPWYLVTTSASETPAVVALRLRPGYEPGWM